MKKINRTDKYLARQRMSEKENNSPIEEMKEGLLLQIVDFKQIIYEYMKKLMAINLINLNEVDTFLKKYNLPTVI